MSMTEREGEREGEEGECIICACESEKEPERELYNLSILCLPASLCGPLVSMRHGSL